MLVTSIPDTNDSIPIYVNVEDYKDISFPNIITSVLVEMLAGIRKRLRKSPFGFIRPRIRKVSRRIDEIIRDLEDRLLRDDLSHESIKTNENTNDQIGATVGNDLVKIKGHTESKTSVERKMSVTHSKIDYLKMQIRKVKEIINEFVGITKTKAVFLVLDDFYFIPKSVQPAFIDYFHRLTKDSLLSLKIATIRHRSRLYSQTTESYTGVETGHDVIEIDMDYSLDSFGDLVNFMRQLLDNAARATKSDFDFNELFSGEGFNQLCIASGGVPRDFLSLFVQVANNFLSGSIRSIGKIEVTNAAISSFKNKTAFMKTDSAEERDVLDRYLDHIKSLIYKEKRTNAFLISKDDLEHYYHESQAVRELLDLRLIHLVAENISKAPSDGRRYEAYIIDVGMYDNSRPRNFEQVEPGQKDHKSRMDDLRASPVLSLSKMKDDLSIPTAQLLIPSFESSANRLSGSESGYSAT